MTRPSPLVYTHSRQEVFLPRNRMGHALAERMCWTRLNLTTYTQTIEDACPACGAIGTVTRVEVPDREYAVEFKAQYAACLSCGSFRQSPMPSLDQLISFYPSDYHAATAHGLLAGMRHRLRYRQLAPLLSADGPILDYGCGNGAFLHWVADQVRPCPPLFGYEIAGRFSIDESRPRVTIIRGNPSDLFGRLPECRLVTMNHVVEHLPDPLNTLTAIVAGLQRGGYVVGQTPAAGSLEQRVFGIRWSGYHAPRHTVIFSRPGLQALLARSGLGQVKVTPAFNPAGLAVSLAASAQGGQGAGRIRRSGAKWLWWLGCGSLLAPVDLLSGAPGVVNFQAVRA